MKKAIIFIDGQNLYYTLRNIDLKEIDIDWTKFLNYLKEEGEEICRTYWFRPEKISNHKLTIYISRAIVTRKDLSISPEELLTKAEEFYNKAQEDFKYIDQKYDTLKSSHENIAIVKKGIMKIDPWRQMYIGEKGVDVTLVVYMIKMIDEIDKVILISGDYDYSEALNYIRDDKLKKVHLVRFLKGEPPKSSGMSRELTLCADKVIDIYESDLKSKFKKE